MYIMQHIANRFKYQIITGFVTPNFFFYPYIWTSGNEKRQFGVMDLISEKNSPNRTGKSESAQICRLPTFNIRVHHFLYGNQKIARKFPFRRIECNDLLLKLKQKSGLWTDCIRRTRKGKMSC